MEEVPMDAARMMPANEFKTHCLRIMDEVAETGQEVIVTKHRKPVAKLVPMPAPGGIVGFFKDVMTVSGDIDKPAIPIDEWEVFSNPEQVVNPIPRRG
ncbi:type II toxin-antitoxin system Phd/YefM family antitoxin [Candidatus Poriferisocius sp.]|uniref:type II toxin-antitoxin system Phd/YefM family antitoxin n=1 Tax=Candidatus Poriferisocius sp. TaxID=3101276 RepID=UPI003B5BCABA